MSRLARLRVNIRRNLEILTTAKLSDTRLRRLDLDYLWRCRRHGPRRGHLFSWEVGVFWKQWRSKFVVWSSSSWRWSELSNTDYGEPFARVNRRNGKPQSSRGAAPRARLQWNFTTIMPTTFARIMATQVVPLPEVERLSSSVIRILGGNPGKVSPSDSKLLWYQDIRHQYACCTNVCRCLRVGGVLNALTWHFEAH